MEQSGFQPDQKTGSWRREEPGGRSSSTSWDRSWAAGSGCDVQEIGQVTQSTARKAAGSEAADAAPPSGSNPQIAKRAMVIARAGYIRAAMPGWKRDIGRRLDKLIERSVPGDAWAVKWNSPFCNVEGSGLVPQLSWYFWVRQVAFFRGTSLRADPSWRLQARGHTLSRSEDDAFDEAQESPPG